jgi:hypothetical protein
MAAITKSRTYGQIQLKYPEKLCEGAIASKLR